MDTGAAGNGTDLHTGTGHFGNFGTTSIRTGTGHFGKFGTTSIPVPDTSVSSVRHPYRYREYRYHTEHTLGYQLHCPIRHPSRDITKKSAPIHQTSTAV